HLRWDVGTAETPVGRKQIVVSISVDAIRLGILALLQRGEHVVLFEPDFEDAPEQRLLIHGGCQYLLGLTKPGYADVCPMAKCTRRAITKRYRSQGCERRSSSPQASHICPSRS